MHGAIIHRKLRFGPFELSVGERVLRRDGRALPLGARALDILIYLADRAGKVIAKRELIDHVWSDVTVAEGTLRVHVAAIRKALGDGQFGNQYIANIKGRGYSFVGTLVPFAGRGQVPLADLGSLTDPRHFAEAIATSLRFAVNLKLLIVLDNGEQAIEAVTLVAEQLSQETD